MGHIVRISAYAELAEQAAPDRCSLVSGVRDDAGVVHGGFLPELFRADTSFALYTPVGLVYDNQHTGHCDCMGGNTHVARILYG